MDVIYFGFSKDFDIMSPTASLSLSCDFSVQVDKFLDNGNLLQPNSSLPISKKRLSEKMEPGTLLRYTAEEQEMIVINKQETF